MNLANPKHELFAKALARNASIVEAGAQAGFSGSNESTLKALSKEPKIVKRIAEIMREQEARLTNTETDIEDMTAEEVRKLVNEEWIIKELVVSIKMSQTASQFNATKSLLEMLGKEIGMFGGNGAAANDPHKAITNDRSQTIINILQRIPEVSEMNAQMVDITPSKKIKTQDMDGAAMIEAGEVETDG